MWRKRDRKECVNFVRRPQRSCGLVPLSYNVLLRDIFAKKGETLLLLRNPRKAGRKNFVQSVDIGYFPQIYDFQEKVIVKKCLYCRRKITPKTVQFCKKWTLSQTFFGIRKPVACLRPESTTNCFRKSISWPLMDKNHKRKQDFLIRYRKQGF